MVRAYKREGVARIRVGRQLAIRNVTGLTPKYFAKVKKVSKKNCKDFKIKLILIITDGVI